MHFLLHFKEPIDLDYTINWLLNENMYFQLLTSISKIYSDQARRDYMAESGMSLVKNRL